MIQRFKKYCQENELFQTDDSLLLTVSGGIDSVAMVHFFLSTNIKIGIAHCNFKLRGEDADLDEQFVKELASKLKIPFYSISFNTKEYALEKGISIQMAARDLRYDWFEKVRKEKKYDYIATAHHKNDVAETMLINLTKGTGIAGLHGILSKKDKIIRPLLGFTREEIMSFVEDKQIPFREDLSNSDIKYTRNKMRHQVISELEKINSNVINTLYQESQYFLELEQILYQKIDEEKKNCFRREGDTIKINLNQLLKLNPLRTYLYFFIKEYGFNNSDVKDIIHGLKDHSGKTYSSPTHLMIKDRDYLILREHQKDEQNEFFIKSIQDFQGLPFHVIVDMIDIDADFKIDRSSNIAYLDDEKISFPLTVRRWKNGDTFRPIGLKGNKKLSDFFVDNKLSLIEKEAVWILEHQEQIAWIMGHRIDDRFKVDALTKKVMSIRILKNK